MFIYEKSLSCLVSPVGAISSIVASCVDYILVLGYYIELA